MLTVRFEKNGAWFAGWACGGVVCFLGIRGPMKSQDIAATKRIVYPMVCTGRKTVC